MKAQDAHLNKQFAVFTEKCIQFLSSFGTVRVLLQSVAFRDGCALEKCHGKHRCKVAGSTAPTCDILCDEVQTGTAAGLDRWARHEHIASKKLGIIVFKDV